VVLGGRGPQGGQLVGHGVEEVDGVAGRAGDADVAHAVAVEVGDVGRAAAAGLGDGGGREGGARLAVEHVDGALGDEHDLRFAVGVEVGDTAEAVGGDGGVPEHLAGEVVAGDGAGGGVGGASADELGAAVTVE